jgi:hypothetical protein
MDDELMLNNTNNPNALLMTSMVGGVSQHNETTMFDEDFPSGILNDIIEKEPR